MTFAMKLTGMKPLVEALRQMPQMTRSLIVVPVITDACKIIKATIAPLIPRQKNKLRRNGLGNLRSKGHYRDSLTFAVREYPLADAVLGVIGAESGHAPHAHLVEEGTKPRFTNSKTTYRRMATRVRTTIKNGRVQTKVVYDKKSTGSNQRRKSKPQLYRGVMPAIHPVARGVKQSEGAVRAKLEAGIRTGITRELTAAKLARGNP